MSDLLGKHRSYLMGFSLLWIIVFHFCYYGNLFRFGIFEFFFSKGYVGVDVFLFLSAYGLCFSFEKNSLRQFYANRIKRIFPMYLLFVVIAVSYFHGLYEDSAVKLAIFQCTGIASFRRVDFEWFIPALIVVYVSFPLLINGARWLYGHNKWYLPVIILLVVLFAPLFSKVLFPLFAYRLPIVFLGILTYFALQAKDIIYLLSVYVLFAVFSIAANLGDIMTFSLIVPMVMWCIGKVKLKVPLYKSVSFIGKHSLEIYLAQSLALNHYYLNSSSPFVRKVFIALLIIAVGSFVLHSFQKGFYSLLFRNEQ